ncbi:hypothetical protein EON81_17595, partial [bacterium]
MALAETDSGLSRRTLIVGASGTILAGAANPFRILESASLLSGLQGRSAKEVRLRGFGRLRATPLSKAGVRGLAIECEDASKADLLLAKFRNDVEGFGFAEPVSQGPLRGWKVADDTYATAYRQGNRVTLAVASQLESLPRENGTVFEPTAAVPMYLDRWDRHGLLFYYSTFLDPPGFDASKQKYDYSGDFEFTDKVAKGGFVFWEDEAANDTAEGLMNSPWWDWA